MSPSLWYSKEYNQFVTIYKGVISVFPPISLDKFLATIPSDFKEPYYLLGRAIIEAALDHRTTTNQVKKRIVRRNKINLERRKRLMNLKKYQFYLPPGLIAQTPAKPRDHSRLLHIDRTTGQITPYHFYDLPHLLKPTDVLVFNNSKVIPARLYGTKPTGGKVEVLLLRKLNSTDWEFISHPGIKPGHTINFNNKVFGNVISNNIISISNLKSLSLLGHTPLPPYIKSTSSENVLRRQYQNVYADPAAAGSSAAPTAGLHFTNRLLKRLATSDQRLEYVTLHVGLGTFKSPTPDQIKSGHLHPEYFSISSETADRLNLAKAQGRRIIAVGTTSCRVLESCVHQVGSHHVLSSVTGDTDIFIQPGYKFKFVDGLITNFHLPGSSLIMLISAFAGWPLIQKAYHYAIKNRFRFFSFGDSCLIT